MKLPRIPAFLQTSGVYFGGSVASGLAFLLFVPVFTRYLSPIDYGLVATSSVLMSLFMIIQGFNAHALVARTFFDHDPPRQIQLTSTAIWTASGLSLLMGALLFTPVANILSRWTEFPAKWMPVIVVMGFFAVIQANYQALLQARREPWRYVMNQIIGTALTLGLSTWLVVVLGWDWRGRILGMLLGGVGVGVLCLYGLGGRLKLLRFTWSPAAAAEIIRFGTPLIPHVLGGWVMTMSARLYLNNMASVADTGLFSLAFNLVSPLTMLVGALNNTYYPWLFSKLSNPDSLDALKLCRGLLAAAGIILSCGVGFGLVAIKALPYIAGPKFHSAEPYIFWLSLSIAFSGIYYIFGNFVVYSKKTSLMMWRTNFLSGIVVLVLCPLLIKGIGPVGAAVTNCIGYMISAIGGFTAARVAYPMPWGKVFRRQKN